MSIKTLGARVSLPIAVNWHFEPRCNYKCKFCFAHFSGMKRDPVRDYKKLYHILASRGVKKITFVGGEPMLDPQIDHMINEAKNVGLTTCIVTNASCVKRRWLESMVGYLDWIGFSIDASNDEMHAKLGRGTALEIRKGTSNHLKRCLESWDHARELGFGLKLNTVVARPNIDDNMCELVSYLKPHRWKVFQVLPVKGENDHVWDELKISQDEFRSWVSRHTHLDPIAEDNDAMTSSYCMLDNKWRFFTNVSGEITYGRSIKDIGIDRAWLDISQHGFSSDTFESRGGTWDWEASNE